jgi:hypothetical protein
MQKIGLLGCLLLVMVIDRTDEPRTISPMTSADYTASIVKRVVQVREQQQNTIHDIQFNGQSLFREMDANGKVKKEMVIERIIYEKGSKQATQYLSMSSNGKALNQKQMVKEIADWEKQGKKRGTTRMPFDPRYYEEYEYSHGGRVLYEGTDAEIVEFQPKSGDDGYIKGFAYIHPTEYAVMRIEAEPAQLPGVIKDMKMIYTYQQEQGYWLPAAFEFSMRLKVQFVLTFVHNTYTLEDHYSGFLLNSGLSDSLFTESE